MKIGVFICHCGSNIAGTVDCGKVAEIAKTYPDVAFSTDTMYTCSEPGQEEIVAAIKEHKLDGVVVASCTPRMHEPTFRRTVERAGLNKYMFEMANIREHVSWIGKDKEANTNKAAELVRIAVEKLRRDNPLFSKSFESTKRVLVIGGGVAGIQAALDCADAGLDVLLVERESHIGGKMAKLDKTFPTVDCSSCILGPKMVDVAQHPKITLMAASEVTNVSGYVGNFTVTVKKKATYVDWSKCTGCGACMDKCPAKKTPDKFNEFVGPTTAINIPFPQAIPKKATINAEFCRKLTSGKCGVCAKVCPTGAINYEMKDEEVTETVGAIVAATGYDLMDWTVYGEYGAGQYPDVITSLQYERIMSASGPTGGHIKRPSDGKEPKSVVFIQCVGSRDKSIGRPYCSGFCCMYTAKHAMLIRDKYPDTDVYVFYIDVRTPGKNFDEFYRRAVEEYGVHYIKGMVGKVTPEGKKLKVQASDLLAGEQLHIDADLVVLAAAIEPDKSARPLATMLTASMDTNDFFTEAHPKLRPVESPTAGIFLSGTCQGPKDIPETVSQAGAAASKVIGLLAKDKLLGNPCVAHSDEMMCNGCSTCERVCPYGAITYMDKEFRMPDRTTKVRRVASVNEAVCQGCGACTVACPSGAMDLKGFLNRQIMAEVDAICK